MSDRSGSRGLHGARVTTSIHLELAAADCANHWASGQEERFVETERTLRELNRAAARMQQDVGGAPGSEAQVLYDAFISHSLRGPSSQEVKRRLITEISRVRERGRKPGLVYWADFLDLAGCGPVPWRKEIEEGIHNSSKVLAFIDLSFLTSYNCIMEIVAALKMRKPVVPIILDDAAWILLTTPHGADNVWKDSAELRGFDGQEFVDGAVFNLKTLKSVFTRLSSINFCSCRTQDIAHSGMDHIAERVYKDATKDLPYLKEWTRLNEQALKWLASGRQSSLLLRSGSLGKWELWSSQAFKYSMEPPPTELHMEYIKRSMRYSAGRRRALSILAMLVLLMILAGAIGSAVMGIQAKKAAAAAREQAQIAEANSKLAHEKSNLAELNQLTAEEKTAEAERNLDLAAILLLRSNPLPPTGRSMRALLKALELAQNHDRLDMVMPQLQDAVRYLAAEPFWPYELEGHFESSTVKFSPSGRYLFSGGRDYTYRVWTLSIPEDSFVPTPQDPVVLSCEVDGQSMALDWGPRDLIAGGTSYYNTICLWQLEADGRWVLQDKLLPPDSPNIADVRTVAFSSSGNLLAAGSGDGGLRIWNVSVSPATLRVLVPANETMAVHVQYRAAAWSPDDKYLIVGGIDRMISVWDLENGRVVDTYATGGGDVNAIDVIPDGDADSWASLRIAAAIDKFDSNGKVVYLTLDRISGSSNGRQQVQLHTVQSLLSDVNQKGVAWSPEDGSMLAATGDDYLLHFWRLNNNSWAEGNETTITTTTHGEHLKDIQQLSYDLVSRSRSLAWKRMAPEEHHLSAPVDLLAAATANGAIHMFQRAVDLRNRGPRLDRLYCHLAEEAGLKHSVRGYAITADMSKLATGAYHGSVCIFKRDPETREWANTHLLRAGDPRGLAAKRVVDWSPDNNLLAVGSDDSMLYVYDLRGGEPAEVASYKAHDSGCRLVLFDPTSSYIVSSGDRSDPTVLIRQVSGLQHQLRVTLHTNHVRSATWISPFARGTGRAAATLASAGDGGVIRVAELERAEDGSLSLKSSIELSEPGNNHYASLAWGAEVGMLAAGDTYGFVTLWSRRGINGSVGGEWSVHHRYATHTATVDKLQWLASTLVTGSKDRAMGFIEVNSSTKSVARTYKTNMDCRRPFRVDDGIGGVPRVVCLRISSSITGNKWTDPKLPVSIEAETVLVGFQCQYDLFRRMVFGRLSLADLSALGYQDLTRMVSK